MISKKLKDEKGQALLELALMLPLLIILSFGVLETGRVIHTYLVVNHAAREGAREASLRAADQEITTKVISMLQLQDVNAAEIAISPTETQRQPGESVTVQVYYPLVIYSPVISNILPNPFAIQSQTTMRIE